MNEIRRRLRSVLEVAARGSKRARERVDCENGIEALGLGANPLLEQLAPLGRGTDLAFLLVGVDANMVHG
ncbi:MAG: hypothetical protein HYR50_06925 [Candidatus Rokubacteria bacterium]|nr:hypothetical protein [Candidatus Rokubacteria bacterium]